MQDSTLAIISICGISLICAVLIGGGIFLVLRFTGNTLSGFLGGGGMSSAIDSIAGIERPSSVSARNRRETSPKNLRAQADSLDFDAAVAKYRNDPNAPASKTRQTPPQTEDEPRDNAPKRRPRRRGGLQEAEDMDDMLGGFADDEGGDILPF